MSISFTEMEKEKPVSVEDQRDGVLRKKHEEFMNRDCVPVQDVEGPPDEASTSTQVKSSYEKDLEEKIKEVKQWQVSALPLKLNIAAILDKDCKGDVMDVARQCKFTNQELISLEQHGAGGGRPSSSFYETLAVSNCEDGVSQLRVCLEDLKLTKAAKVLNGYGPEKTIGDITPLDLDKLSLETTFVIKAKVNDWKHVAQHFKKDPTQFEPAIKQGYSYSRTAELFCIIGSKYLDKINIGEFLNCVINAGNNEAKNEIEKQIKKLAIESLESLVKR